MGAPTVAFRGGGRGGGGAPDTLAGKIKGAKVVFQLFREKLAKRKYDGMTSNRYALVQLSESDMQARFSSSVYVLYSAPHPLLVWWKAAAAGFNRRRHPPPPPLPVGRCGKRDL